jgi:hypothetical protein
MRTKELATAQERCREIHLCTRSSHLSSPFNMVDRGYVNLHCTRNQFVKRAVLLALLKSTARTTLLSRQLCLPKQAA